jgi:hypothetical protein
MVFVISQIDNAFSDEKEELVVNNENKLVPIQHLTGLFVGSKCASYAEKPKVFFFLDYDSGRKVDGSEV